MRTRLNPWFFAPFLVALAGGGIILLTVDKGKDVLFVNGFHSPFFDYLFTYGTTLGNGLLYVAVGAILAWKNFRKSALALLSFSLTGILIQVLKKAVFPEMMRPSVVLEGEPLHFVEGVKVLSHFSFPSGHTAIAFSMFSLLALMVDEKKWGLPFIFMALIGGISRIYLAQHFFADVYFGALLGVTVTLIVWFLFLKKRWLQHWDEKSISSYLRKQ